MTAQRGFEQTVNSWRGIFASIASLDIDKRLRVFENCTKELATNFILKGADKRMVTDMLAQIVDAYLADVEPDEIHRIMADEIGYAEREAERVPDLDEPRVNGKSVKRDGHHDEPQSGLGEPPLDCPPWWRDPKTIPPRAFLYGNKHYARRNIGASIGGGGRLKTSQALFEAVEMACGRNLTTGDALPIGPLRVLCLNAEEDQDELDRRVAALCQLYKVTEADLGGRLFVTSVRDHPLRFATLVGSRPTLNQPALATLTNFIQRERIDVFMLDPWISFHAVRENENVDMDLVIKQGLGRIADATNSAGEIFHHPGKPKPGQDTTVDDARGASAIIFAVRSARVFNFMTPAEANQLGISEGDRRRHIRIANGKANLGPIGGANWIKVKAENLPNGDEVACATLWEPPNPFEGVSVGDKERAAKLAQGDAYRFDVQSPQWYGWALARMLNIPISYRADNDKQELVRVKRIIKTWIKNKVLDVVERKDEGQRKARKYIVAGPASAYHNVTPKPNEPQDDDL